MLKLVKILFSLLFMLAIRHIYRNLPRKITNEKAREIKEKGISHITNLENIQLIMDDKEYANLKASSKLKSYANFFRKSVFFFLGNPDLKSYKYNIARDKKEKIIIKVLPQDISEDCLKQLRWRKHDKAIIHIGDIKVKAEAKHFNISNDIAK